MRVTRTFSFDDEKDAELLQFLDGCRNSSDSVRGILKHALGMQSNQGVLETHPPVKASQDVLTPLTPNTSQIPVITRETQSTVTTTPINDTPIRQSHKISGLDGVLAVMNVQKR